MSEVGLLEFQMAEIVDAIRYIGSGILFIVGVSIWVHATYFCKEDP